MGKILKKVSLKTFIILTTAFFFSITTLIPSLKAEENGKTETTVSENKNGITLQQAIEMAILQNLDIMFEKVNPLIQQEEIRNEESRFDPNYYLKSSFEKSIKPTGTDLAGTPTAVNKNFRWDTGFKGEIATGTDYSLDFTNVRQKTNSSFTNLNPSYTSEIKLNITQPLLKDFGLSINKTKIIIADNNRKKSIQQLKNSIIDIISNVKETYWDLVYNLDDKKVKELSLKRAEDFLERTRKQVDVGTLAPIDIIQAEAEVATRKEGVIVAETNIKNAEDRLKQLINVIDKEGWNTQITPLDKPQFQAIPIDLDTTIETALSKRPDIHQAIINLDNSIVSLKFAKNQLLPSLNFVGSFGLNGLSGQKRPSQFGSQNPAQIFDRSNNPLGESYEETLQRVGTGNYYSWVVGIELNIPLGNRAANSRYVKSNLENEQAVINLNSTRQKAIVDIRTAVRNVQTNIKRIETTTKAYELAQEKLEAEEKKYEVGMSTAHDVLEFQEDLANAEINKLKAVIDYNKSLVSLDKASGITLENNSLDFPEGKTL